jgi:hypothetical protein
LFVRHDSQGEKIGRKKQKQISAMLLFFQRVSSRFVGRNFSPTLVGAARFEPVCDDSQSNVNH